jgi:hypothetical protein
MRVSLKASEGEVFDTHVGHRAVVPRALWPHGEVRARRRRGCVRAEMRIIWTHGSYMCPRCVPTYVRYICPGNVRSYIRPRYGHKHGHMSVRMATMCVWPRCVQDVDVRTNIRSYFVHRGRAYGHMEHAHHCTDTLIMVLIIITRIALYGHAHRRSGCVHAVMSTSWTHA